MWTDTLSVVTDLVTRTAAARGETTEQVDAVIDILSARLDATVGLQVRADVEHLDVSLVGSVLTPHVAAGLRHRIRATQLHDPLFGRVREGDLTPTTAERVHGRQEWARSDIRRQCRLVWGVDHVATMPVRGGDRFVVFLFGRPDDDFTEADLALVATVQPVVIGLGMLTDDPDLPASGSLTRAPTLTAREHQVLTLLAQGHKAATIARLVGCSQRTVHRHLGNIYAKLHVGDRLSAVRRASELGMLDMARAHLQ